MRPMRSFARFSLEVATVVALAATAHAADKYPNFAALAAAEKEGADYRITLLDRRSPIAVLAIHGGAIEPGSDQLARAIARDDWSLYVFESLKAPHDNTLHVTATHFDEPQALALAMRSAICIAPHGMRGDADAICIGGANAKLRRAVHDGLERAALGIPLEEPCARLPGVSPENIDNRCERQGVQLELSASLRSRLLADPTLMEKLATTVRDSVQAYDVAAKHRPDSK
jgi:phage replication-related protein YjqB (UPF0714/DUF867 family)